MKRKIPPSPFLRRSVDLYLAFPRHLRRVVKRWRVHFSSVAFLWPRPARWGTPHRGTMIVMDRQRIVRGLSGGFSGRQPPRSSSVALLDPTWFRNAQATVQYHGIWIAGGDNLVQQNVLGVYANGAYEVSNAGAGVQITAGTGSENSIRGNLIYDNGFTGDAMDRPRQRWRHRRRRERCRRRPERLAQPELTTSVLFSDHGTIVSKPSTKM